MDISEFLKAKNQEATFISPFLPFQDGVFIVLISSPLPLNIDE